MPVVSTASCVTLLTMLSELCVLQVHLASGFADGASYGLERAFEPPRLARPQRGRAARPTIGSAGDPSLGRAGPGVSAGGSELRPRANQSWYAVTLGSDSHSVRALQTPDSTAPVLTSDCDACTLCVYYRYWAPTTWPWTTVNALMVLWNHAAPAWERYAHSRTSCPPDDLR